MSKLSSFYKSLVGQWALNRKINNIKNINGIADFKNDGSLLKYSEILEFETNTHSSKEYYYSFNLIEDSIAIYFDSTQKNLFVKITDISNSSPFSHHKCIDDLYSFRIIECTNKHFKTQLEITGPKKKYKITSSFLKI